MFKVKVVKVPIKKIRQQHSTITLCGIESMTRPDSLTEIQKAIGASRTLSRDKNWSRLNQALEVLIYVQITYLRTSKTLLGKEMLKL